MLRSYSNSSAKSGSSWGKFQDLYGKQGAASKILGYDSSDEGIPKPKKTGRRRIGRRMSAGGSAMIKVAKDTVSSSGSNNSLNSNGSAGSSSSSSSSSKRAVSGKKIMKRRGSMA